MIGRRAPALLRLRDNVEIYLVTRVTLVDEFLAGACLTASIPLISSRRSKIEAQIH